MKTSHHKDKQLYVKGDSSVGAASADALGLLEEILNRDLCLRMKVTGKSMMPFLKGGEVMTIRRTSCSSLRKGDLILFRNSNDVPVLHRIIKKQRASDGEFRFVTKGDAMQAFDEEIHGGSVLGKVLQIEKPCQSGKIRHIDMNSMFHRYLNLSIAVAGLFKTHAYCLLAGAFAKIS